MIVRPSQRTILRVERLIEELRAHRLPTRDAQDLLALLKESELKKERNDAPGASVLQRQE